MKQDGRRQAFALILVLAVMALLAGVVAGLAYHAGALHAQLRSQRVHAMARFASQSAVALVHQRSNDWSATRPAANVELSFDRLLSSGVTGVGMVEFSAADTPLTCDINVNLRLSRQVVHKRTSVQLVRPDTRP